MPRSAVGEFGRAPPRTGDLFCHRVVKSLIFCGSDQAGPQKKLSRLGPIRNNTIKKNQRHRM